MSSDAAIARQTEASAEAELSGDTYVQTDYAALFEDLRQGTVRPLGSYSEVVPWPF